MSVKRAPHMGFSLDEVGDLPRLEGDSMPRSTWQRQLSTDFVIT